VNKLLDCWRYANCISERSCTCAMRRQPPSAILHADEPPRQTGQEAGALMNIASFLVALVLLVFLTFATAAPVWAHAELVESHPSGGDVLAKAPQQVRLRFDEPVTAELDPIMVYSEESERVDQGNARVSPGDPKVVSVDLKKLPDGVYGVDWSVISEDGHVLDGALGFTVDSSRPTSDRASDPKGATDEGSSLGTTLAASLAILTVCVVGLAVFVVVRRR
jgi:copper resistance protein C